MSTFQRARSAEQREIRRRAILETAAEMLSETTVSEISLNELSRRVGLAKSNVLRYFESREAVLLQLLVSLARDFVVQMTDQLSAVVEPSGSASDRSRDLAAALATAFEAHPMMCELLSAQASVLERNVSTATATAYKRSAGESMADLAAAVRDALPELSEEATFEATRTIILLVGTLWTHSHPPQAIQDAYTADPGLTFLPDGFAGSLERSIRIVLAGLLAGA